MRPATLERKYKAAQKQYYQRGVLLLRAQKHVALLREQMKYLEAFIRREYGKPYRPRRYATNAFEINKENP